MYDELSGSVNGLSTVFPHFNGAPIELPRDYLVIGGSDLPGIGHNGPPADEDETDLQDYASEREGWVKISRAIRDHWLVGFGQQVKPCDPERGFCYSRSEAWLDLIMECRYSAGTVNNNGRKMEIKPGQLVGAVSWLANRWNWTPKTVRGFLDRLAADGMIETGTNQGASKSGEYEGQLKTSRKGKYANIITICKYELYQLGSRIQGQVDDLTKGRVEGREKGELGASSGQHIKVERKEERKNIYTGPTAEDVRWAHGRWNDMAEKAKLPISPKLTANISRSIKARLREHGRDGWERALALVYHSGFLRGRNDRGFTASLAWFAQPKNFDKVASGTYGNGPRREHAGGMSEAERAARLRMIENT